MKTLLLILVSMPVLAGYGKPQLVARYAGQDTFEAPAGIVCFGSEPAVEAHGIYLSCINDEGFMMVRWSPTFEVLAKTPNLFSRPESSRGRVVFHEFSESGVQKLFISQAALEQRPLRKLGPSYAIANSFTPYMDSFLYRLDGEGEKGLLIWKNDETKELDFKKPAHFFPPVSAPSGEVLLKIRRQSLSETAPDELWLGDGETWNKILSDRDADYSSPWTSFRHSMAHDQGTAVFIANDGLGEALYQMRKGKLERIIRAGENDVESFDYFSPKIRNGIIVFRGVDSKKRKAFWVYDQGKLSRLVTQGDVVMTDKGLARVDYANQDALFYGAAGIGPTDEIVLQATLTDIDSPATLLGVGVIKFNKE